MQVLFIILTLGALTISGCGGSPNTLPTSKNPSKGKQIVDCMDKGSPEDCDRRVNRRSRDY